MNIIVFLTKSIVKEVEAFEIVICTVIPLSSPLVLRGGFLNKMLRIN